MQSNVKQLRVGLLGIGTVGGGTYQVLTRNAVEITRRTGVEIIVTQVADRNIDHAKMVTGGNSALTSTFFAFPQYSPGTGGTYFTFVPATTSPRGSFYSEAGQYGGPYKQTYEAVGTNQYFLHKIYGYGGAGANTVHYNAEPSIETFSVIISPASTTQTGHSVSRSGIFPGGGGSGSSGFVNDARSGANGLILIHY